MSDARFVPPDMTVDQVLLYRRRLDAFTRAIGYAGTAWNLLEHVVADSAREYATGLQTQHLGARTEPTNQKHDWAHKHLKALSTFDLPPDIEVEFKHVAESMEVLAKLRAVVCHSALSPVTVDTPGLSWSYARGYEGVTPFVFDEQLMLEYVDRVLNECQLLGFVVDHLFSELNDRRLSQGKSLSLPFVLGAYYPDPEYGVNTVHQIEAIYQRMRDGCWFGWPEESGAGKPSTGRWASFWQGAEDRYNDPTYSLFRDARIITVDSFDGFTFSARRPAP